MVDLRIVDAPSKPTEDITGEEKIPTGGSGNYSVTLDSVADFTATKKDLADNQSVNSKVNGVRQELDAHIEDLTNPHQVTKVQIGLGNVDNTADADKPVSNSTQAAIISAVTSKADKSSVYTKSETYNRQETQGLVDDKISIALSPINSEIESIERYTPLPYTLQNYAVGQRVTLIAGEIVENQVPNNNVDPNTNMLGWVKVNSADQIVDASGKNQQQINNGFNTIADMLAIESPFDGMRIFVKSYRTPNLALNKPHLGGGEFVYVISLSSLNDGVSVFNGFVRLDRNIDSYCAGAYGDGVTDDTQYIQRYFNYIATRTNKDAPLFGEFLVDQVLLKSQHNGLIVRDGKLKKIANPSQTNLALIEVGHKSNTDDDISGMLFKNLVLEASAQYTGDYNVDDTVNTASKQFCTGINVVANPNARVKSIFFENIHGIHLGNACINVNGADYSSLKTITSDKVNKHTIGASVTYFGAISTWPADFNPVFDVNGVNAIESGTIFDLSTVGSSKDNYGDKCATAIMTNLNGTDLTLRTKIHGYWDTQITNFTSIRKQFAGQPLAPYAGIDVANLRIKRLKINNMTVEGAVAGIINYNSLEGDTQITNLTVKNSLRGLIAQCSGKVTVNGFNTENCFEQYLVGNDTSLEINGFNFKKCRKSYWQAQVAGYSGITLSAYPIQGTILNHSLLNGSFEDFGEDDVANTPPAYIAYLTVKGTNNISNVKFLNAAPIKQGNGLYFETATGATTYLSDITEKDKFVNTNIIRSQGTSAVDGTVNQMLTLTKNLNLISNVNEKFACTLSNNGNFWIWLDSDNKPRFSLTRPLLRADGQVLGATT